MPVIPAYTSNDRRGPQATSESMPVTLQGDVFRCGFTDTIASPGLSSDFDLLCFGAGQTISQTGGNLVITTGTTANEEVIARSKRTFSGAHTARWKAILSQRIAQNNFVVELADLIGDNLAFTNPSATTVVVTFPTTNPFSALNVGQTITIGDVVGVAGVPGDAVIASTSGLTVTLTVAGWPGAGSGTLMLYGFNCYRALYDGTTATNIKWEPRRRGYNSTFTAFTMTTTASPGHVAQWTSDSQSAQFGDTSATMATTTAMSIRSIRMENLPDETVNYYLFIRAFNGTSAPATTTTFTVGFTSVEEAGGSKVQAIAPATPATASLGNVTVSQSTGSSLNAQVTGAGAQGATATGNPVFTAGVAKTALATARTDGQIVAPLFDKIGRMVGAGEQVRDLVTMAPMVTLTTTAETTIVAQVASVFNDLRAVLVANSSATPTVVSFRTTTAGTVVFNVVINANGTEVVALPVLAKQATVNTNWTAQLGTAVTSVFITPFVVQAN